MLIQLPREPKDGAEQPSVAEGGSFEAGVRRDLATASIVSYEPMLGGWLKRTFDIVAVVLTFPLWLPALTLSALWAKLARRTPVFIAERRIGYGGRAFKRFALQLHSAKTEEPSQEHVDAHANEQEGPVEPSQAKWVRALEHLPQLVNVLRGEMSLVGPGAVTEEGLDRLKTGKRYYLSARPGIFTTSRLVDREHEESQFKAYSLSWSPMLDLVIIWDGVRGFRNRGQLWRPSFKFNRVVPGLNVDQRDAAARRRSAPSA